MASAVEPERKQRSDCVCRLHGVGGDGKYAHLKSGLSLTPCSKIWDTHTGEPLFTIQHNHIVRAIAYPSDNSDLIATGGAEKRLRVFDLTEVPSPTHNGDTGSATIQASEGFEIGEGTHTAPIKFIAWTKDPNTIVTASDNTLRWFDLPTRSCTRHEVLDGEIKSCELVSLAPEAAAPDDIGGGLPVLAVAAGKWVYFWGGPHAMEEIKRMELKYTIASVALDLKGRKLVVGEEPGTWARVINWDSGEEIGKFETILLDGKRSLTLLETHKGHHGPIWSIAFSPDGKLYATGSEDGTIKMWKNCEGFYGLWRGGVNAERGAD